MWCRDICNDKTIIDMKNKTHNKNKTRHCYLARFLWEDLQRLVTLRESQWQYCAAWSYSSKPSCWDEGGHLRQADLYPQESWAGSRGVHLTSMLCVCHFLSLDSLEQWLSTFLMLDPLTQFLMWWWLQNIKLFCSYFIIVILLLSGIIT